MNRFAENLAHLGAALGCIALLTALGLYLRWPVTEVDMFRNEDVAGITYNADLLRHGKVPLVDNLEYKAPGAFFLVHGVWKIWGRSMASMETFGMVWVLLAAAGVFVAGRFMFGYASGLVAGLIFAVYAPLCDSMTVNYNTWMIAPYVWSTAFFVLGLARGRLGWFVACGVAMTLAALCKRQGGVLFPLYLVVLAALPHLSLPEGWARPRPRRWMLGYLGGLAAGFVPIGLFYLVQKGFGGLYLFIRHFFFSSAAWRYVSGELEWTDKVLQLEDAFTGFYEFLLLPTILACLTIVAVPQVRRRGWAVLGLLLGGHFLLSFIGLSLGFRFYKGYYLHALPAAAWLAAHADGPLLRWFNPDTRPMGWQRVVGRVFAVGMVLVLVASAGQPGLHALKQERLQRRTFNSYQHEAVRIAAHIRKHTRPDDRIWVWGRWAWPVYFHADRLSVTRFYKVLGVITNNLTNTWKRPTVMTRYVPGGPDKEIGRQLAVGKPAYIVSANNEDYTGFTALEDLLRDRYEPVPMSNVRAFRIWRLKPPSKQKPATSRPAGAKPREKGDS